MNLDSSSLNDVLKAIAAGTQSVESGEQVIASMLGHSVSNAGEPQVRIDLDRLHRCGYPEVIYAPGKPDEVLVSGFRSLLGAGQNCLATRCTASQSKLFAETFPDAICDLEARTVRIQLDEEISGMVAVVSAGTSDLPVAKEALETLRWMNVDTKLLMDVGVAGPQRFLSVKDQLDGCAAVIVVAGMEGALPSVVGGWVSCPVIAVPTSVGYGAAFGGLAALLGMLNSCAANVTVVNIDAGFKAAYVAGMIAQQHRRIDASKQ